MFASALALTLLSAVPAPQAKAVVRERLGKELEALVEETVPDFWGAVLVAPAGEVVLARGYGLGKGGDKRIGADFYFDVGSISKTYTAVALLRLEQEQALALDDPLSKWLPEAPADKGAITLRQLLQHASGFSRKAAGYTAEDYDSRESVLAAILAQPLVRAPGSEFEYSNVNYTLLAAVVELAAQKPFEEQVARTVFDPCELEDTSFAGWPGRKLDKKRGTQRIDGGMRGHVLDYPWGWGKRGITNVVTSVRDLHRFAQALRAGELLDHPRRELLFTPGPGDYTCGLEQIEGPGGRRFFGHGGSTNGYGSVFWLDHGAERQGRGGRCCRAASGRRDASVSRRSRGSGGPLRFERGSLHSGTDSPGVPAVMRSAFLPTFAVLSLAACATSSELRVVEAATPEETALLFDQVKALEGTWEMADEQGQRQVASVFTLSSNGSVVREVMFPGAPHEMTNVYHMDGPTLVMTHYCAEGNQPRMRACTAEPGTIAFRFDSVTNLTDPQESYMGELTLVRVDADTLSAEWKSLQDGKVMPDHSPVFTLTRKK